MWCEYIEGYSVCWKVPAELGRRNDGAAGVQEMGLGMVVKIVNTWNLRFSLLPHFMCEKMHGIFRCTRPRHYQHNFGPSVQLPGWVDKCIPGEPEGGACKNWGHSGDIRSIVDGRRSGEASALKAWCAHLVQVGQGRLSLSLLNSESWATCQAKPAWIFPPMIPARIPHANSVSQQSGLASHRLVQSQVIAATAQMCKPMTWRITGQRTWKRRLASCDQPLLVDHGIPLAFRYWGWSRSIMGFPINQAVSRDRGFWTQQFILTKIHFLIQHDHHDHHDPTTKGHQDCQLLVLIWKKFNISAEGWLTWEPTPSGSTMSLGQKFRVMASYCLASSSESMIYHATSGVFR